MKIRYRQKVCFSRLYPFLTLFTLTLRAMAVTAAIVAYTDMTATAAAYLYDLPMMRCGSALEHQECEVAICYIARYALHRTNVQ